MSFSAHFASLVYTLLKNIIQPAVFFHRSMFHCSKSKGLSQLSNFLLCVTVVTLFNLERPARMENAGDSCRTTL